MTTRRIWIDSRTARRAIHLGFVANPAGDASLLGTACEGRWIANIVTSELEPMSRLRTRNRDVRMGDATEILRGLRDQAIAEDRHIMAWNLTDIAAVRASLPEDEMLWWEQNLVNAQQVARNWKMLNVGWFTIEPDRSNRYDPNPITSYMWAAGYGAPACMRFQPAGAWECFQLRRFFRDYPDIDGIPPRLKERWIDIVDHNRHHCLGLAEVMRMVGSGVGLSAYGRVAEHERRIHRSGRRPRLPRMPRRAPGTPVPALEVLSTVPSRSVGRTVWPTEHSRVMDNFGGAWCDGDAFFMAGPTEKAWSVTLIIDPDSTSITRRDIEFDGHPTLNSALSAAANLNWFIDRVPTRDWIRSVPETTQVG